MSNSFRFTQLGIGWILREVSVYHLDLVIDFLNSHQDEVIKEAVRYAVEKMPPSAKKRVKALNSKKE